MKTLPAARDLESGPQIKRRRSGLREFVDDVVALAALQPMKVLLFQRRQDCAAFRPAERLYFAECTGRKPLAQLLINSTVGRIGGIIQHGNNELEPIRQFVRQPAEIEGFL